MPKKFSDTDKRKWLELYEDGKTEIQIKEYAKCDLRTVRRGIEEARRKQEAKLARLELVKEALRKHQDSLLKELDDIISDIILPTEDFVVLSWSQGGDYILAESDNPSLIESLVSERAVASRKLGGAVRQLLKEHLKNDRLWKVLGQWENMYKDHLIARTLLQHRTVASIQKRTGCKMVERKDSPQPFIYSYTTGDLFFRAVVSQALGTQKNADLETDIVASADSEDVRYHSLVLAETPGSEGRIKVNLLDAFRELKGSPEALSVASTYRSLEEAARKVRQVVEQIKLLGLIPGQCEICRRLGM